MILSWRLKKPYLIYCCIMGLLSLGLLLFTIYQSLYQEDFAEDTS